MYLRSFLGIAAMACLVSCSADKEQANDALPDAATLLNNNDPRVCASQEVLDNILGAINEAYPQYLADGGVPIRVDMISADEIKPDIHEIACNAQGHFKSKEWEGERQHNLSWRLRPALEDKNSYIYQVSNPFPASVMLASHMALFKEQPAEQPSVEDAAVESASNDQSLQSAPDSCNASVLYDVMAIQQESSVMKAGTIWPNVTQFWKNHDGSSSWFCAHGDYCYPAQVTLNGQKVDAIKLLNCSVSEQGAPDESGDVLFSVG